MDWKISSSFDPVALDIVDGTGRWHGFGPHYSRRTPGSKSFVGVGQEIVLVSTDETAVWAVVRQKTPSKKGSGASRGRGGETDLDASFVWRNMIFRNLGQTLSSTLISSALFKTYDAWQKRYGCIPSEILRTEIDPRRVKSRNPGYCYKLAGFHRARKKRGKIYLDAPCLNLITNGSCECCPESPLNSRSAK